MDLFADAGEPQLPFRVADGVEFSYRWDAVMQAFIVCVADGELIFAPHFFSSKISDRCVAYFQENDTLPVAQTDWQTVSTTDFAQLKFTYIGWQRDSIRMYGKQILLPRLTAWYADARLSYTYSGITSAPQPWNPGLLYIKRAIEQKLSLSFNSVLLNWYRSGEDHMGWHADDEPELGPDPVIASANFGATRDFILRRTDDPSRKIVISLQHGSVLVMQGALQHHWQHSVPKRKKVTHSRFNLTFRTIVQSAASFKPN